MSEDALNALPSWWSAEQPPAKTDPEDALFSDEHLFAAAQDDYDGWDYEDEDDGWDYESAPAEVREVMDAISEAVGWLEGQQGIG